MAAEKSNMSGMGCLMMIAGLVGSVLLSNAARGGGSRMMALGADGARLLIFVGLAVMLIGFVRNARK